MKTPAGSRRVSGGCLRAFLTPQYTTDPTPAASAKGAIMTKTKQPETTIIRGVRSSEHPYVQIARSAAQDSRLSFDARGMLLYLFSKPDDWHIREKDLMNASQAGRAKTRRIMKELQMYGYLTKHPSLADVPRDDKGYAQYPPLKIYDIPEIQPESENQTTGNQTTGNRTHTVLKKVQIKEDTKKETTPPNGAAGKSSKNKPVREVTDLHHAVADLLLMVYPLYSNGNYGIVNALIGKATSKHDGAKFYKANLNTVGDEHTPAHAPITADEFRAWHKWRLARAKGNADYVPSAPDSVVDSILAYRAYMATEDAPTNGATPDVPPISDDEQRRFDVLFGEGEQS